MVSGLRVHANKYKDTNLGMYRNFVFPVPFYAVIDLPYTHIIGVPPYSNSILYRFHPSCMGMTIEQAKKLDHFVCSDCVKENGSKRLSNAYATSPNSEPKVS
jgi:hypothetical protein